MTPKPDPISTIAARIRDAGGDQLAACREAHLAVEALVLRAGLEAAGWGLKQAARELCCAIGTLRKALGRHPDIEAERVRKGPAPMRRRKTDVRDLAFDDMVDHLRAGMAAAEADASRLEALAANDSAWRYDEPGRGLIEHQAAEARQLAAHFQWAIGLIAAAPARTAPSVSEPDKRCREDLLTLLRAELEGWEEAGDARMMRHVQQAIALVEAAPMPEKEES